MPCAPVCSTLKAECPLPFSRSEFEPEEETETPAGDGACATAAAAAVTPAWQVELEVMVAEPSWRRQGLAREAVQLLVAYVLRAVPNVALFVAKISDDNEASLRLFRSLGFGVHRQLSFFAQTELHLSAAALSGATALPQYALRPLPWDLLEACESRDAAAQDAS